MEWSRVWRRWCNFWLAGFGLIKYGYPENYVLRAVEDQIATLLFFFPQLRSSQLRPVRDLPDCPLGAEGWFAIVRWQALAKTRVEATKLLFKALNKNQPWRCEQDLDYLLERMECEFWTAQALDDLHEEQASDILLVPAQFGLAKQCSTAKLREDLSEQAEQFALGLPEVLSMILANPGRLDAGLAETKKRSLGLSVAGDYFLDEPVEFSLLFRSQPEAGRSIEILVRSVDQSSADSAIPTAFLLSSKPAKSTAVESAAELN